MVLLRTLNSQFYIASADNIIQYNVDSTTDLHVTIPKPLIPNELKPAQIEVINKSDRSITSLEFSNSGLYMVAALENKQIVVYDKCLKPIKNILANRAPSKACFTNSDDIIVSDKTGDVYLYKLQDEKNQPILLLGHLSVILDVIVSNCGNYIITSDRDEKIRVSHYPNCYNIASYCLGHTEFVNKIQLANKVLISASGDGTVRYWDFVNGKQLGIINTADDVEDKDLLKNFSQEMNKEKVEISALPIVDMQLYMQDNKVSIAVSIYKYDFIHLYSLDLENFISKLHTKLNIAQPFSFVLGKDLFVLNSKLQKYEINDNQIISSCETKLNELYKKYSSILKLTSGSGVTVLYKRSFDNVQDYLERKKQRL